MSKLKRRFPARTRPRLKSYPLNERRKFLVNAKTLFINDIIYILDESIKINFIHTNFRRHYYYHFINY